MSVVAKPAQAERENRGSKDKRGYHADRKYRVRGPTWTAKFARLLIYLSTLRLQLRKRRIPHGLAPILRKCLENRKYFAHQKLERLFRIPSTSSSGTWTSKGSPTTTDWTAGLMRESRSGTFGTPPASWTSNTSLRLGQKTSGLFDTEQASDRPVASVDLPNAPFGFDLSRMDSLEALDSAAVLGDLFGDVPQGLTEADYLDTFMDLSNLLGDAETKGSSAVTAAECEVDRELAAVDFSGLIAKTEPQQTTDQVASCSYDEMTPLNETSEVASQIDTVNVMDLDLSYGSSTSDHDYVSRKAAVPTSEPERLPAPGKAPKQSKQKYRERRDKNNVASQRSRQIRKQKYVEMDKEGDRLKVLNETLRKKITDLEELAKVMKAELIKKMTTK